MRSWLALIVGVFIVGFHWTMVAFHVGPFTPLTAKILPIKEAYINPIFRQYWALFAPNPPTSSLSLTYQCELTDKQWSEMREPTKEILDKHYKYRITYHGKVLALIESMARNLNNEKVRLLEKAKCDPSQECEKELRKELTQSENYLLAQRFVTDLCKAEFGSYLSQKMYIIVRNVKPFTKRNDKSESEQLLIDFTI